MERRRILPPGFIEPCIPSLAAKPPFGPGWVHEIKHDGYRLIVHREGKAVRLFTRRGYDWTDRYPAIAAAAAKLRAKSFTLDGEAVVAGEDGIAVFDALHRRHKASDAMLYAFDLLERRRGSPPAAVGGAYGEAGEAAGTEAAGDPCSMSIPPARNHHEPVRINACPLIPSRRRRTE
jgi:bifunctional non-homologous end joining protein LigD